MIKYIRKAKDSLSEHIINITQKYLPKTSRELLLNEYERLKKKADAIEQENRELRAYINGLEAGVRTARKIVINNTAGKEAAK